MPDTETLVHEGGSSKASGTELGLVGWEIAGWREHGATYGKAVAFARQEMSKALARGVDDITHEFKPANPMAALPRLVYDLFTIAIEGLPTVAEMPPLVERPWTGKKPPTSAQCLVDILHEFLVDNDAARMTKDGCALVADPVLGVYTYSSDAIARAVKKIGEVLA